MDNLAKVLVIVPLAVIGAVVAPRALSWYGESRLAEEFAPALATFDAMISNSDVKDGILPWGKKSSSIPTQELPTIRGGIFIMRPSHPIYRRRGVEERMPASIDPSFFELDKSLRAASVSAIRTVVHVTLIPITSKYQEKRGGATLAILNLMVARLQIYDAEDKTLLGSWKLHGKPPLGRMQQYDMPDLSGPPIVEFLGSLPRR